MRNSPARLRGRRLLHNPDLLCQAAPLSRNGALRCREGGKIAPAELLVAEALAPLEESCLYPILHLDAIEAFVFRHDRPGALRSPMCPSTFEGSSSKHRPLALPKQRLAIVAPSFERHAIGAIPPGVVKDLMGRRTGTAPGRRDGEPGRAYIQRLTRAL